MATKKYSLFGSLSGLLACDTVSLGEWLSKF